VLGKLKELVMITPPLLWEDNCKLINGGSIREKGGLGELFD